MLHNTNPLSQKIALAFTSQTFQALQERGLVSTMHPTKCCVRAPFTPTATAQGHAASLTCFGKQQSHTSVVLILHCFFLRLPKLKLSRVAFQLSGWTFLHSLTLIRGCENDRAGSDQKCSEPSILFQTVMNSGCPERTWEQACILSCLLRGLVQSLLACGLSCAK